MTSNNNGKIKYEFITRIWKHTGKGAGILFQFHMSWQRKLEIT